MPIKSASRRIFLDIGFDPIDLDTMINALIQRNTGDRCQVVMTPNVDHVVRAHRAAERGDRSLLNLYRDADRCLCDSRVLSALAKLCGISLPVVPGSDLTLALFKQCCRPGDRIAIVGGTAATLDRLAVAFPDIAFFQHRPPMRLREDPAAMAAAALFVATTPARFTLLAVGSPQQELIAHEARCTNAQGTTLCIGASLDFLTGTERRAPRWMQKAGLEWAHRLGRHPVRMFRRYLVEGPRIFLLAWQWRQQHG